MKNRGNIIKMATIDDGHGSRPLIHTKLSPPQRPRCLVSRQRLLKRLRPGIDRKLTAVVAPAGFGKSTLLAEWRETLIEEGYAVAWVSLDREDDDLSQVVTYLLAAISGALPEIGKQAQSLLRNDPLTPANAVLSVLINEVAQSERPVFLFLDDFDCLTSTAIYEAIFRLFRYTPSNFHGVLACRAEPSMQLSNFLTSDQLVRLDADDLRFVFEETQSFFAQGPIPNLDKAAIGSLLNATDGWVAGLQLASLSLAEHGSAANMAGVLPKATRDIDTYLTQNVLSNVPQGIVKFMLRTSILDSLSPELCDAVTGGDDGKENLDWLELRNMFIKPIDENRNWFRYHMLLSDYLRRRLLRQHANEIVLLQRRASEWFAAQGLWPEAVKHALAAGDLQQAAIWIENRAMMFVERSDVRTVLGLVSKIPAEATHNRFGLRIAHAWALAFSMRPAEATKVLDEVKADMDVIRCELLAVSAAIAGLCDDSSSAIQFGQSALAMLPSPGTWVERTAQSAVIFGLGAESRFDEVREMRNANEASTNSAEPTYADVYRQSMFGLTAMLEGRMTEATHLLEAALERAETAIGRSSAAAVLPAGYLSALAYERNDLQRANAILENRLAIALEVCPLGSLLRLCLTFSRLLAVDGSQEEAHRVLDLAQSIGLQRKWPRMQVACMGEAIRLYIAENRFADAKVTSNALRSFMHSTPSGCKHSLEVQQCYRIAQSRLLIGEGNGAEAEPDLRSLFDELQSARRLYDAAGTSVLLAVALEQAGNQKEALRALKWAVLFGQKNGLIRTFLDEGKDVGRLVSLLALDRNENPELDASYVDKLLAAFHCNATTTRDSSETLARILSAREIEVLDYVARGLANKEIARALQVAPETVKWHLKHIYEKLNVSTRIQAARKFAAS